MATPRKRTVSYSSSKAPTGGHITINTNAIIGITTGVLTTLFGGVLLYMVTSWISTSKENAKAQATQASEQTTKLNTITTYALPTMQKSIDTVQADVKEANVELKNAKATMITRPELDAKNLGLTNAIKEVKDSVHDVTIEQNNVRDALLKAATGKPPK